VKEIVFQNRNIEKWELFDKKLNDDQTLSYDEVSELYTELNDDLAYAQTYFPNSETAQYLNSLLLKIHYIVHKKKENNKKSLLNFWAIELPLSISINLKPIGAAAAVFIVGIIIGVISTLNDAEFARLFLGDAYMDMTIDNIKNGTPFDIYAQEGEFPMFFQIMWNNIKVAITVFAAGVLLNALTGYLLLRNGVMVGVFHALLYQYGLLKETFLAVWLHGTIELSVIVFAGGAGFILGNALLNPGTYTRVQALANAALSGGKIILGLIPFFVVAAFIEGYLTRHYLTMSISVKLIIIGLSAFLIIGYLVVYPLWVQKKNNN